MSGNSLLIIFALSVIIPLAGMFIPTAMVIATIIVGFKFTGACIDLHKYIHDKHNSLWIDLGKPIMERKLMLSMEEYLDYLSNMFSRFSLYMGTHSYIKNSEDAKLVEMTKGTRRLQIISLILFAISFLLVTGIALPFLFLPNIANSIN